MEAREITIVSTTAQKRSTIMSSATTLRELKDDLRKAGIDYTDMTFYEGLSRVELTTDDSILPHDIPYKGRITNNLVFMLTGSRKKIKSGAMSRAEVYAEIRNHNLQDECLKKFGKNFTMCKTADLISLIDEEHRALKEEENVGMPTEPTTITIENVVPNPIVRIVEVLAIKKVITESEAEYIMSALIEKTNSSKCQTYNDDEIEEMFNFMCQSSN